MIILIALGITSMLLFVESFVALHLWEWFLVPLGLPAISMAHVAGIVLLKNIGSYRNYKQGVKSETTGELFLYINETMVTTVVHNLVLYLYILTVGWILADFM